MLLRVDCAVDYSNCCYSSYILAVVVKSFHYIDYTEAMNSSLLEEDFACVHAASVVLFAIKVRLKDFFEIKTNACFNL